MGFVSRTLRKVSIFRNTISDCRWEQLSRVNFSSGPTPIKMAFDVYQSSATDPKLPPLIVMHGLLGSRANFRTICKSLEGKTKRKIYNVDARNHGDSPHDSKHSLAYMTSDIVYLMKEEKLKRVSVLGHSMGGRTMMYFALNHPQLIEKAIIVDISPVSFPSRREEMDVIYFAMKTINIPSSLAMGNGRAAAEKHLIKTIGDKENVKFLVMNLRKEKTGKFVWGPNITTLYETFTEFQSSSPFTEKPPFSGSVLFIGGKKSKFLNPADWPKIKKIFPNAELTWIDAGHLIHFSQPDKFMQVVADFLNKVK